ncbi:hypothetical protein H6785_01260 [Candidatus Nomurabacteria bacterium]|nr:hypothetical protein [Candidatus Kaiserbacteria bacterium]MCB9815199.1 hypothetical protein [Candidatus Nomurabacteria bacterium]
MKSGLPGNVVQRVLETQGKEIVAQFVGIVRERVEAIEKRIVRLVEGIDRGQTAKEAIESTGRNFYGDISHAIRLPIGTGDTENVTFIPLEKRMSPGAVDSLVEDGGYKYASLHAVAKHNKDHPDFAEKVQHFIQSRDKEGRHSYAAFLRWNDDRSVDVDRYEVDWRDDWFVAVVPAS